VGRGLRLKLFAALLLRAMAQEQAEGASEGISPRHPNVARRLGLEPDSPELAVGERYLEEQGYIRLGAERGGRRFRHHGGRLGGPGLPPIRGRVAEETLVEEDARGLGAELVCRRAVHGGAEGAAPPRVLARFGPRHSAALHPGCQLSLTGDARLLPCHVLPP
jgi:hypothetical protein